MAIVNDGLNVFAANMVGSGIEVSDIAYGSSGASYSATDSSLASEKGREAIIYKDLSTPAEVTYNTSFTPTEVSGTVAKEFGTFTSGNVMLNREVMTGSFVFNGTQEFHIQHTIKFNISGA